MKKVKVGIIGTGGISTCHMDGYLGDERCEVSAVCDINEARVKDYAAKYGVPRFYTDYQEMLDSEDLDAVSVCTPNNIHAPASIAALKSGKHVLCEKPMAMNTAEALKMEAEAKKSNKLLMIGLVRRYGNDASILRDFIQNGYLGDIYYARATYLRRNGCPGGWFSDKEMSGGGPLIDLGVHIIDLVRYLMDGPKAVSVSGITFNKLKNRPGIKNPKGYVSVDPGNKFTVEDMAVALVKFDNGAALNVETSFSLNLEKDVSGIELFGTKAGARLNPELTLFSEQNGYLVNVQPAMSTKLSFDGLFENEIKHFIDCIVNGEKCKSPAEAGVEAMRIIDAIYKSSETGREVIIER